MADLVHKTVTVTAVATSIADLLNLSDAEDIPLQSLSLQGGTGAAAIFVGGPGVTTTDFGIRLPAAAAGVPSPPERFEYYARPVKLSEIYVVGTPGNLLHVCGFTW